MRGGVFQVLELVGFLEERFDVQDARPLEPGSFVESDVQEVDGLVGEFDGGVLVIEALHKCRWTLGCVWQYAQHVIDVSLPQEWLDCHLAECLFLQLRHEDVGVSRCHFRPHCRALHLVVHLVGKLKVVVGEDYFQQV